MKKAVIAAILAMSMFILMSSALQAFAATHQIIEGSYTVTPNGNVWKLRAVDAIPAFSGLNVDVSTIVATVDPPGPTLPVEVNLLHVTLTDKFIILIVDPASLPSTGGRITVTGTLNSPVGDTFLATGPGFTFRSPGPQ